MFSRGRTECPTPSSKAHILCCWEDGCAPSPFSPSVLRGQSVCKFPSSFPLSVFPHPRIYHTLVLSLTPSARDSWLLLISFNLYKLKRCFFLWVWKLFIWMLYIWKVLNLYLSDISVCFCLSFEIHTEGPLLHVSIGLMCSSRILYTSRAFHRLLFSMDSLNWSEAASETFKALQKISISTKCSSFECSVYQKILKKLSVKILSSTTVFNIDKNKTPFTLHVGTGELPECLLCEHKHVPGLIPGSIPGWGPSNISGFSPGTSAVWTKSRINAVKVVS